MKSNNKIQYIVIILLILLILYLSVNNMEKFTVTPASSSEAIANITSMYNNGKLIATAIDVTGNITGPGELRGLNRIEIPGDIQSRSVWTGDIHAKSYIVADGSITAGNIEAKGRITAGTNGDEVICIKDECINKDDLKKIKSATLQYAGFGLDGGKIAFFFLAGSGILDSVDTLDIVYVNRGWQIQIWMGFFQDDSTQYVTLTNPDQPTPKKYLLSDFSGKIWDNAETYAATWIGY